jgi:APA family basic amino acid/polyamine antiporter
MTHGPVMVGGWQIVAWGVNVPAMFIIAVVAGLLIVGTRESATLNAILVLVKIVDARRVRRGGAALFRRRQSRTLRAYGFAKHDGPTASSAG